MRRTSQDSEQRTCSEIKNICGIPGDPELITHGGKHKEDSLILLNTEWR